MILAEQNGGGDGALMNIHTNPNDIGVILGPGWAPLRGTRAA